MTTTREAKKNLNSILARPYRKELIQNSDGTWFAHVAEFAGCMTEGDTVQGALDNLEDAMRSWVTVQLEDGGAIPLPASEEDYSGKFLMRVPKALHRELALCAQAEGVSLNQYVVMLLSRRDGEQQIDGRLDRIERALGVDNRLRDQN